jgi:hypothetical protein
MSKPGLDGQLARLTEELNAASSLDEINNILDSHCEWIGRLSKRGEEQIYQMVVDICRSKGFYE